MIETRTVSSASARELFARAGLDSPRASAYRLEGELESLLRRSFPNPGDEAGIRDLFTASLTDDRLGIGAHRVGDEIHYGYPVAVLVATRR
jgi:hypothetical protein